MKTKTPENNVRIMKNTTSNVGMKTKTPQHNVRIKKNTTKQCKNKEKHHKTM
jgi:hypothetical protein